VTARRTGLFNEALAGFYRTTEAVARDRAARAETTATPAQATEGGSP
jgi:hypothetical protein